MPDARDYPLAGVLGTGNLIHHARPAGLLGKRIETRCGLEGDKTDRDGGIWCPDCLALERAKAGTHDERGGDADPYDWDPVYAATAIDRLQKQLAAATARVEKAEALAAMNADLLAVVEHFLSAYVEDPDDTVIEAVGSRVLTVGNVRDIVAVLRGAAPDGRSEPVERSETSGGIGTASNSSTGAAGLSEACGNKYSYHVCFLPAGHDGGHRDDRYWRWPTHLGTWTNYDTTEDGQHG